MRRATDANSFENRALISRRGAARKLMLRQVMRFDYIREGKPDSVFAQVRRHIADAKFFLFALNGGGTVLKGCASRPADKMSIVMMCMRKLEHRVICMIGKRKRRHACN
jgi:hypothetical protein